MSQAKIGALHVSLGLDTAEFQAGAKRAQSTLGGLTSSLKAFAVGAAGALSLGAIVGGLRSAADHMDNLGKAAQKIGIPVEELSKLEYAARLSDVSLGDLETTLARFSKSLGEIAGGGKNDAGAAMKALGISAVDVDGKLRPTSELIIEIAEEFSVLKDGANKTALAIALFGKSGADMIPLLNGGRMAFEAASEKAKAFGLVVSEDAAKAAERFNDSLTDLMAAGEGVVTTLASEMLPAAANLTEALVTFVEQREGVIGFIKDMAVEITDLIPIVGGLEKQIEAVNLAYGLMSSAAGVALKQGVDMANVPRLDLGGGASVPNPNYRQPVVTPLPPGQSLGSPSGSSIIPIPRQKPLREAPIIDTEALKKTRTGIDEAALALDRLRDAGQALYDGTRTPLEQYQLGIRNLNDLMQAHVIDNDLYMRGVEQLREEFAQSTPAVDEFRATMEGLAGDAIDGLSSSLSGLVQGTVTVSDAFESMKSSLLSDLSELASQFLKSGLTTLLFGGAVSPSQSTGNLGGILGALFGGFGGARAGGGPVSFGKSYLVGENGPELFSPGSSGNITPNDMMGGGGGATVNVYNQAGDATVEQRQRQNSDGSMTVDVWFKKKMQQHAPDVNRRAIPGGFGIPPSLISR